MKLKNFLHLHVFPIISIPLVMWKMLIVFVYTANDFADNLLQHSENVVTRNTAHHLASKSETPKIGFEYKNRNI